MAKIQKISIEEVMRIEVKATQEYISCSQTEATTREWEAMHDSCSAWAQEAPQGDLKEYMALLPYCNVKTALEMIYRMRFLPIDS